MITNYGAVLDLRKIPSLQPGMSPMEIWSRRRRKSVMYLAIRPSSLELLKWICRVSIVRLPYSVKQQKRASFNG